MDLSIQEVATLLGRSTRTVRAQVARGELPGVKRKGRWLIPRQHLPLTEAQRHALQAKADAMRQAVETALPSRLAVSQGQRFRSIADLDAFRLGARLLREMRTASPEALQPAVRDRITALLEQSLLALAEAVQQFDRAIKIAALHRCRAALAQSVALLLLEGDLPPGEPLFSWVASLEGEIIPAVSGFARWAEGLREGRR